MKTRAVVWTIAGILVVAGVIFFVATSRNTSPVKVDLARVREYVEVPRHKLEKFVEDVVKVKASLPPGTDLQSEFAEIDRLVADAKEKLERIEQTEGVKEAYDLLRQARESMRDARRALKVVLKKLPQQRRSL